jgi:hypothetical protein
VKLPRRQFLRLAAGTAALPACLRGARAQAYPTRPITMIVPFPPGGVITRHSQTPFGVAGTWCNVPS